MSISNSLEWRDLRREWSELVSDYPDGVPWRKLRGLILRFAGVPERITTNLGIGSVAISGRDEGSRTRPIGFVLVSADEIELYEFGPKRPVLVEQVLSSEVGS